jgi:hypothetical protein
VNIQSCACLRHLLCLFPWCVCAPAALYSRISWPQIRAPLANLRLIRYLSSRLGCGSYQLMQMGRIQSDDMLQIDSKIL